MAMKAARIVGLLGSPSEGWASAWPVAFPPSSPPPPADISLQPSPQVAAAGDARVDPSPVKSEPTPVQPPSSRDSASPSGFLGVAIGLGAAVFIIGLGVLVFRQLMQPMVAGRSVRIISIPPGEAPLAVRTAWVGLILPLTDSQVVPDRQVAYGVMSGARTDSPAGFAVNGSRAVQVLSQADPKAAQWWRENAPQVFEQGYELVFPAEVCEMVA